MLTGKRILITGIATPDSIATSAASCCLDHGARLVRTGALTDTG